jgi:hypothetical protein
MRCTVKSSEVYRSAMRWNSAYISGDMSPLCSALKTKPSKKSQHESGTNQSQLVVMKTCYLLHAGLLLCSLFSPEDGNYTLLRNIG